MRRDGRSFTWHQPCQQQNSVVTTSVDILNALCKAGVSHSLECRIYMTRAQLVCSEAQNSDIINTLIVVII